jgi:hypothetical protein
MHKYDDKFVNEDEKEHNDLHRAGGSRFTERIQQEAGKKYSAERIAGFLIHANESSFSTAVLPRCEGQSVLRSDQSRQPTSNQSNHSAKLKANGWTDVEIWGGRWMRPCWFDLLIATANLSKIGYQIHLICCNNKSHLEVPQHVKSREYTPLFWRRYSSMTFRDAHWQIVRICSIYEPFGVYQ